MSTYSKYDIYDIIAKSGIVPVFYHPDLDTCKEVLSIAYEAGIRAFEFTNRGENAYELFLHLKKFAEIKLKDLALGIGTISNAHDTRKFLAAGADFIVSPIFKKEMANECNKAFKLFIPGCASLTEIITATDAGALIVKLFPANAIGQTFIASVLAPFPNLKLMPTGGINPDRQTMESWFSAGATCVGIGSQLFSSTLIEAKEYQTLLHNIKNAILIAQNAISK